MASLSYPQSIPDSSSIVSAYYRYHQSALDVCKLEKAEYQRQFERDLLVKEGEIARLETQFYGERARVAALEQNIQSLLREKETFQARLAQTESGKHLSENVQAQIKSLQEDSESKMIAENFALKKEVDMLTVQANFLKTSQNDYKTLLEDKLKLEQQLRSLELQSEIGKTSEGSKANWILAEKRLRQELTESRTLVKKQTTLSDKLQREVDKLNSKLLTQKSVFEGKIEILQAKLKTAKEVKKIVAAIKPNAKNGTAAVPDSFNSPIKAPQSISGANSSSASGLFSMTPFLSKSAPRLPPNDNGPSFASPTASTAMKARTIASPARDLSPGRRSINMGIHSSPMRLDQVRGSLASSTPLSINHESGGSTRSMSLQPSDHSNSLSATPVKSTIMRHRPLSSPVKATVSNNNPVITVGTSSTNKQINVIPQTPNSAMTSPSMLRRPTDQSPILAHSSSAVASATANPVLKPCAPVVSNGDAAPITKKSTQNASSGTQAVLLPSIPDPPILSPNSASAAANKARSAVPAKKAFSIFDSPIGGDLFSKTSRKGTVSLNFTNEKSSEDKENDILSSASSSLLNEASAVPSSSGVSSESAEPIVKPAVRKRKRRVGGKRPVFQDDDEENGENRDEFDNPSNPGFDFKRVKPGALGFVKEISPRRARNDIIRDQFSI